MTLEEGSVCGVDGCAGVFRFPPPVDCTCHISPPCNACVESLLTCDACGLDIDEAEEMSIPLVEQSYLESVAQDETARTEWRQACRELLGARKRIAEMEERLRGLTKLEVAVVTRMGRESITSAPRIGEVVRHATTGMSFRVKSVYLAADLHFLPGEGGCGLPPLTLVPVAKLKTAEEVAEMSATLQSSTGEG